MMHVSVPQMALTVATLAHAGQVDKAGNPYIGHPLRVGRDISNEITRSVAYLHDVVEDTVWTLRDLELMSMPAEVVEAVDAITRRKGESSDDYYARVKANPIALEVKLLDIADNSDEERLALLDVETADRLRKKYEHAREVLLS